MKHSLWQADMIRDEAMKVCVVIEESGCITTVSREVEDSFLPDVLQVFEDALRGAGYTYVKALAAEKSDGTLSWSDSK